MADSGVRPQGNWAVILGGSSGFGLATARRVARGGLNVVLGHKDKASVVETELAPHFAWIRAQGVSLVTHNGNLFDEDERAALLQKIEENAGPGRVHLFLHSVAAGSCKRLVEDVRPDARREALRGLTAALGKEGVALDEAVLARAVDRAFHDGGCDALFTLAESRIPFPDGPLEEDDFARTIAMMGYDHCLWGRELHTRGLLTKSARLVALTSEGNAVAWRGYAAVSAAKAVLESLCRSMATELGPSGVRCALVQAGITDTPAGNGIPGFDLLKAQARLRNPGRRLTTPEDVAEAIWSLCQKEFDWLNGAIVRVDGGEAVAGAG